MRLERVVAQLLAVRGIDGAVDGHVEALLAGSLHDLHRPVRRVRVDRVVHRRARPVHLRTRVRDDAAVLRGAVERERQRCVGVRGLDQDRVLQVVLEAEVRAAPRHGRVAADRIVREVEVVVRAREDRQPDLERVVEERRRRLTDPAADRGQHERADDLLALEKPALRRARADDVVEREDLARLDDRAVDEVGHQVDVVDAVRRGLAHLRRVRDQFLPDPELLRLGGRQVGVAGAELDVSDMVAARGRP